MKRLACLLLLLGCLSAISAQEPVVVMESSFKVKAKDSVSYYFSFAAGDKIIFDFEDANGLDFKQIEIIELPQVVKSTSAKVAKVEEKIVNVSKTAVYEFKFSNPTIIGHTCQVKIQRVPRSYATQDFNTAWKWETLYDTSYVHHTEDSIVGLDSVPIVENVKELVSDVLSEQVLLDNVIDVKAKGIVKHDDPRYCLTMRLPDNTDDELKSTEVVAWAYWIAVGKDAASVWSKNKSLTKSAVKQVAKWVGVCSPLAALALGVGVDLVVPDEHKVDNVEYAVFNNASNKTLFMKGEPYKAYQKGFGPGGYGRISDKKLCQGTKYICLYNDNMHQRIRVSVKASAIVETKTYQWSRYERYQVTPRYVPVNRTKMVVKSHQERVPAN